MADTATYAGAMKTIYPTAAKRAAKKQRARRPRRRLGHGRPVGR